MISEQPFIFFPLSHMHEITLFNNAKIRRHRSEDEQKWYFSVVDVVGVASDSTDGRKYRNKLKQRLQTEWNESVTNCHQLKMLSSDGKYYKTDVADTEIMLRIIQSVPSPNAEPIKLRLAKVWYERVQEMNAPEQWFHRLMWYYAAQWYDAWRINQRLKSIEIRKELTDERQRVGIQPWKDYAILTNEITKAWSGMNVAEYKKYKSLHTEDLRDNMSNLELVINMLAEATTSEISKVKDPTTFAESQDIARQWWDVAYHTRKNIESKTKKSIVTKNNALTHSLEKLASDDVTPKMKKSIGKAKKTPKS
jgi:hypothetical protein